jgi:Resolvase, N terminal domain
MSTEHQQYSTENQREVISQYAERRGMVIVRTYTDAGKSGLRIDGREALKQLILGVTMFTVFEATKENLGSDEGGQACTGANS